MRHATRGSAALQPGSTRRALAALAALFALGGCATVNVVPRSDLHEQALAPDTAPIAHVYAATWGIYLFKVVPLVTGDLDNPGMPRMPAFFTDTVRVDRLADKVTQESQRQGGTVVTDLRTSDRSHWLAWSLLFWLVEYEASGNASRSTPAVDDR